MLSLFQNWFISYVNSIYFFVIITLDIEKKIASIGVNNYIAYSRNNNHFQILTRNRIQSKVKLQLEEHEEIRTVEEWESIEESRFTDVNKSKTL